MCLILFAYKAHPGYSLIVGANRDEFYNRPTLPASFWPESFNILAGKDLKEGGTWMGITKDGRFAALTNYRDLSQIKEKAISRGHLVADFLKGKATPKAYLGEIDNRADEYNGFNLLVGDREKLFYYSNIEKQIKEVEPGIYGISNHFLDTPWPKVVFGKQRLNNLLICNQISTSAILEIMADETTASDDKLPDTGVGLEWERLLSALFIKSQDYGTRSSTAVLVGYSGKTEFEELTFSIYQKERVSNKFVITLD